MTDDHTDDALETDALRRHDEIGRVTFTSKRSNAELLRAGDFYRLWDRFLDWLSDRPALEVAIAVAAGIVLIILTARLLT